eukprot:TRINITY_DN87951_c0_g1_i1.p3 TRINITY_DN87951_c0_g1~~TRINITY_DN87951_c0_g1_i1.p3  ORF type:complete len:904 (-),score=177.78 TRINITY_DN87951_c0_g1_i1:1524-4235(-)
MTQQDTRNESPMELLNGLSLPSTGYLSSCSQVALEAYDRVLAQIKNKKEEDDKAQEDIKRKTFIEEQSEKTKKERLKRLQEEVKEFLDKQVQEKREREVGEKYKEKSEFNNLINTQTVFPQIADPPKEHTIHKRRLTQEIVKKTLQDQIAENEVRRKQEKAAALNKERETIQKANEELVKEQESLKNAEKEKREQYCKDLRESLQYKGLLKATQKKLDTLKVEDAVFEEPLTVENEEKVTEPKKETEAEIIENFFRKSTGTVSSEQEEKPEGSEAENQSDKTSKFELLLEKKKKKAHELLKRIEILERAELTSGRSASTSPKKYGSLAKMKSAMSSQAFTYVKDGKKLRVEQEVSPAHHTLAPLRATPRSVRSSLSHCSSNSEQKPAKNNYEKTLRQAFNQCLSKIESQANEEQRKILDLLKKEHERVRKLEEEKKNTQQKREQCKKFVLQQIEEKRARKLLEKRTNKEIPDIAGTRGYPPLPEPTMDEKHMLVVTSCKHQSESLMKQIKEKEEIRKRQLQADKAAFSYAQIKEQEEQQRLAELRKKQEEQRKWREIWDVESMIRRLRTNAESGKPHLHLVPLSPQKSPTMDRTTRSRSQHGGFFVTSGDIEGNGGDLTKTKYKSGRNYGKKEMWANKAFQQLLFTIPLRYTPTNNNNNRIINIKLKMQSTKQKSKKDVELQADIEKLQLSNVFTNRNLKLHTLETAQTKTEVRAKSLQKTLYYFMRHPKESLKLPSLQKSTNNKLSNEEVIELAGPKPVLTLNEVLSQNVINTLNPKAKRHPSRSVNMSPTAETDMLKKVTAIKVKNFQSPINKVKVELIAGLNSLGEADLSEERMRKVFNVLENVSEEKLLFGNYLAELMKEIKKGVYCSSGKLRDFFPFEFFDGIFVLILLIRGQRTKFN